MKNHSPSEESHPVPDPMGSSSGRICLIALLFQLFIAFTERKKEGTIQYGNSKLGTHAQVFSQTLADGNSKNEIR